MVLYSCRAVPAQLLHKAKTIPSSFSFIKTTIFDSIMRGKISTIKLPMHDTIMQNCRPHKVFT